MQPFPPVLIVCIVTISSFCFGNPVLPDQKVLEGGKGTFDAIRSVLKEAKIINEVVDDFKPRCYVAPFYGSQKIPVALGNIIKTSKTKGTPSVKITCPRQRETSGLTLVLTDPDAPSRDNPRWSEMCHFVGLIPIDDKHDLEFSLAGTDFDEIVEYKPPGPPPKTGYHRYVFLLLEGNNTNLTAPGKRQHWGFGKQRHGVRDWAKQEGLKVVGANFFIEKNKSQ
ncbi:PEBP-like protein [Coleophoma crateriformis]|uniref:PEBP-like protein n=1 Tax=Coleophoma crateriformis TaxID=565419 RepID=A0A3D8T9R7_9HELO|nr:PEBP-like protein [Coleophoma crateriformis]